MSVILIALLAAGSEAGVEDAAEAARPYHEINRDIDSSLRGESLAKTALDRGLAIRRLCALYGELRRDVRLEMSPTLQGYKAKVWRRLVNVKREIVRTMAQRERLEQRGRTRDEILADRAGRQEAAAASRHLADQMSLVNYSLGGPSKVFAEGAGALGGAPVRDLGDDLVRLIEHTIAPDFWETNGGPGAIFYYAPLHALVVRATGDLHRRIGGVIGGLRAAGP